MDRQSSQQSEGKRCEEINRNFLLYRQRCINSIQNPSPCFSTNAPNGAMLQVHLSVSEFSDLRVMSDYY